MWHYCLTTAVVVLLLRPAPLVVLDDVSLLGPVWVEVVVAVEALQVDCDFVVERTIDIGSQSVFVVRRMILVALV